MEENRRRDGFGVLEESFGLKKLYVSNGKTG
jgi:hypothetical protein